MSYIILKRWDGGGFVQEGPRIQVLGEAVGEAIWLAGVINPQDLPVKVSDLQHNILWSSDPEWRKPAIYDAR